MFTLPPSQRFSCATLLAGTISMTLMLPLMAEARTSGGGSSTIQVVQAITAAQFLSSLGVNTHFNNNTGGNAYTNVAVIESELQYAGFQYARDNIYPTEFATLEKVNKDIGTKFDVIVSGDPVYTTQIADIKYDSSFIAEIEGPNEIDIWPVTYSGVTSFSAGASLQKQLYATLKGTPALASLPIDSLTISDASYYPNVGNIAGYCDYSSSHIYPQYGGDSNVLGNIQWSVNSSAADTPGKPPVVTEFGWWTSPVSNGVSFDVQAKSTLNFFFDAYKQGIRRSYLYELNDEYADAGGTNIEFHFGLFQANGTPKPAATAMYNMTRLLADPTPLAKPTGLPFTISKSSSAPAVYSLLMERGDGIFIIALWQDPVLWSMETYKENTIPAEQVLIQLGITARAVAVYDPMMSSTTATQYLAPRGGVGGFTQMVPDHPIFVYVQL